MLLELRHALRGLRRSPGFAASAIVTLALAIGASTAMFGVLDAVLLRPLPFPSPDRLAMVWIEVPNQDLREGRAAFGTVEAWRRQSRSFADVAVLDPVSVALTHAGELEQVSGARVSPNLFGLLGVVPARGRLFTDRDAEERQRLAVLSHRFWRARFGGSDAVLGTTVLIDGQPSRIVGVLPDTVAQAGFTADVWEPHTLFADWDARRAAVGCRLVVRDRPAPRRRRHRTRAARARGDPGAHRAAASGCCRHAWRPHRDARRAGDRSPIARGGLAAHRGGAAGVAGGGGQRRRAHARARCRPAAAAGDPRRAGRQPRPARAIVAGGEPDPGGKRRHHRPGLRAGRDARHPRVRAGLCRAPRGRPSRPPRVRLGGRGVGRHRAADRPDADHRGVAAGPARDRRRRWTPGHVRCGDPAPPVVRRRPVRRGHRPARGRRPAPAQLVEREPRRPRFPDRRRRVAERRAAGRSSPRRSAPTSTTRSSIGSRASRASNAPASAASCSSATSASSSSPRRAASGPARSQSPCGATRSPAASSTRWGRRCGADGPSPPPTDAVRRASRSSTRRWPAASGRGATPWAGASRSARRRRSRPGSRSSASSATCAARASRPRRCRRCSSRWRRRRRDGRFSSCARRWPIRCPALARCAPRCTASNRTPWSTGPRSSAIGSGQPLPNGASRPGCCSPARPWPSCSRASASTR